MSQTLAIWPFDSIICHNLTGLTNQKMFPLSCIMLGPSPNIRKLLSDSCRMVFQQSCSMLDHQQVLAVVHLSFRKELNWPLVLKQIQWVVGRCLDLHFHAALGNLSYSLIKNQFSYFLHLLIPYSFFWGILNKFIYFPQISIARNFSLCTWSDGVMTTVGKLASKKYLFVQWCDWICDLRLLSIWILIDSFPIGYPR